MNLYRIIKTQFLASAWSGYGAQQFDGHWNHPGKAVVYTASHISLAMLEVLVHLQKTTFLSNYSLLSIEIPDNHITTLSPKQYPKDWQRFPAGDATMSIGDNWLLDAKYVGLCVPSVIVPQEYNVILNPNHPEFIPALASVTAEKAYFDSRLFK